MASRVTDQGNWSDSNAIVVYCDTASDIDGVNTDNMEMGSMLYVIATAKVYCLNSQKVWIAQN